MKGLVQDFTNQSSKLAPNLSEIRKSSRSFRTMNDFERLTRAIFAKFSVARSVGENSDEDADENRVMTRPLFSLLTSKLHRTSKLHPTPSVPKKVSLDLSDAVFSLLAGSAGVLTYDDFEGWWSSSTRFIYFRNESKGKSILKAFALMKKYGSAHPKISGAKTSPSSGAFFLESEGFAKMMKKLGRASDESSFESLDVDDDGKLSFRELFQWLDWGPFP